MIGSGKTLRHQGKDFLCDALLDFVVDEEEVLAAPVGHNRHAAFLDVLGDVGNTAGFVLTMDGGQTDNGDDTAVNEVFQDVTGTDARQLVHITDDDETLAGIHGLQEALEQQQVNHRELINDNDILFKVVALVILETVDLPTEAKHAVDGGGIIAGTLLGTLCRTSCRGTDGNAVVLQAQGTENALQNGGLAGTGTARKDHDPMLQRLPYRGLLHIVIGHVLFGLDMADGIVGQSVIIFLTVTPETAMKHGNDSAGTVALGIVILAQIHLLSVIDELAGLEIGPDGVLNPLSIGIEDGSSRLLELVILDEAVPLVYQL